MVSFDELCRQLAFYNSGDSGNFDVIILTFSLLSYWETSQSLWLSSFARGVVSSTNMKLVQSALEVIFESQAIDGTWVKGGNYERILVNLFFILLVYCPFFFSLVSILFCISYFVHSSIIIFYLYRVIFHFPEPIFSSGDSPGGSRDIGNSYVFFFDIISCLLSSMADTHPELLAPYLPNFEKYVMMCYYCTALVCVVILLAVFSSFFQLVLLVIQSLEFFLSSTIVSLPFFNHPLFLIFILFYLSFPRPSIHPPISSLPP
jgi:hypothetical protein